MQRKIVFEFFDPVLTIHEACIPPAPKLGCLGKVGAHCDAEEFVVLRVFEALTKILAFHSFL